MAAHVAAATTTTLSSPTSCGRRALQHSAASLASTASSGGSFRVRTRVLRPVAASLISYGRSSKIRDHRTSKSTTLYVVRVARSGRDWYVARRYSEFRALHEALAAQLPPAHRACAACRELATFYGAVRFPQRFRLRSSLFSKRVIEAARMRELNQYLSFLIETTQGLLDDDDDDDDDDDEEEEEEERHGSDKCPAMTLVRDFLMVDENEHLLHDQLRPADVHAHQPQQPQQPKATDEQLRRCNSEPAPVAAALAAGPTVGRPRLSSKGSTVASFRVRELDVLYKEKEARCAACVDPLSPAVTGDFACNPVFENVFEDFPAPPLDAIVQHQQSEGDAAALGARANLYPLRCSESLCHDRF